MIIEVNRAACEGHGLCEQTSPEIFGLDQDGYEVQLHVVDEDKKMPNKPDPKIAMVR